MEDTKIFSPEKVLAFLNGDIPEFLKESATQGTPKPRCECGHKFVTHDKKTGRCLWHRPDHKTKREIFCDCTIYWIMYNVVDHPLWNKPMTLKEFVGKEFSVEMPPKYEKTFLEHWKEMLS